MATSTLGSFGQNNQAGGTVASKTEVGVGNINQPQPTNKIAIWDQSTQDLISEQISKMDTQSDDIWTRLFGGLGKTGISEWRPPGVWADFSTDVGDVETSMGDIADKVSTVAGQAGGIRQDLTMAQGSFGGPQGLDTLVGGIEPPDLEIEVDDITMPTGDALIDALRGRMGDAERPLTCLLYTSPSPRD